MKLIDAEEVTRIEEEDVEGQMIGREVVIGMFKKYFS